MRYGDWNKRNRELYEQTKGHNPYYKKFLELKKKHGTRKTNRGESLQGHENPSNRVLPKE